MREYAAELYALVVVYSADVTMVGDVMNHLIASLKAKSDNQVKCSFTFDCRGKVHVREDEN